MGSRACRALESAAGGVEKILACNIHDRFCCNRRFAAITSLTACFTRPAGRFALCDVDELLRVRLSPSGLRVPASSGTLAVSSRTVMSTAG